LFIRGQTGYNDFSPGDSFTGSDNGWFGPKLERAVYRFDLQRQVAITTGKVPDYDVVFSGGRDLVYWANGLTLSQVLDGGSVELSSGQLALKLLAGLTDHDTVDFDSSRPDF